MFDTPHFKANNEKEVLDFMKAHPFITLCGVDKHNMPVATHVPVLMGHKEGKLVLRGHIQRKTDHHKAFTHAPHVLAIFTGPHSYVSASWYQQKEIASTWNYQSVHARGTIHFGDDAMLLHLLTDLTAHFENDENSPSLVNNLSHAYLDQHMKAIIAFEIAVTEITHVFKLSQNRDEVSRNSIIEHLSASDDKEANLVAEEMKKHYHVPTTGHT
jgi:transcriptional regulator